MKKYILPLLLVLSSCSKNIFDEIADKDTNEAKFFQAKREINSGNFALAIDLLESLDASFIADRDRIPIYASAYAGRCGLVFLTLLNNMQNVGSATIFAALMAAFPGAAEGNEADCVVAERSLLGIGDEAVRNGDENLLAAFNGLAKVGVILSSRADADDDGSADAGFDQCDVNDLPDDLVREVGASLAVVIKSFAGIGTSFGTADALDDVQAICDADPNLAVYCNATDPSVFTANQVQALRYAIGSSDIGIDSCGGNDFTTCAVANPSCP